MKARVIILPDALQQMDELPLPVFERLTESINLLEDNPYLHEVCRFRGLSRYRMFPVGNYRVYYVVRRSPRAVLVVWVEHGHRRPPTGKQLRKAEQREWN